MLAGRVFPSISNPGVLVRFFHGVLFREVDRGPASSIVIGACLPQLVRTFYFSLAFAVAFPFARDGLVGERETAADGRTDAA